MEGTQALTIRALLATTFLIYRREKVSNHKLLLVILSIQAISSSTSLQHTLILSIIYSEEITAVEHLSGGIALAIRE